MSIHKIIHGKSEIELKQFEDNSIDSCVTDPPYELSFMNRKWDSSGISFKVELWGEVYRVLKPGAHILVFGGTRTYHRMACAVEDAGFEVRDMLGWFYGSGFPKSLDISKSLDKMNGKAREVIGKNPNARDTCGNINICKKNGSGTITAPTSKEAIQWNGWGTNLKPSHEPILLARKSISERNIASNVLKWGVGGINVDGCRIEYTNPDPRVGNDKPHELTNKCAFGQIKVRQVTGDINKGRFPSNLLLGCCCEGDELVEGEVKSGGGENAIIEGITSINHPHRPFHHCDKNGNENCLIHTNPNCVCRMLGEQSGNLNGELGRANRKQAGNFNGVTPFAKLGVVTKDSIKDNGGASRFFYQAKASQKERWFYCMICKQAYPMKERDTHIHNAPEKEKYKYLEFHPTQKPLQLIQYLIRLITPPNGTILDPFLGSGTGLIAAEREGFNAIGIDSNREYCLISNQRLKNEIEQEQTKLTKEQSTIQRIGF